MATPIEIVETFCAAFVAKDLETIERLLHDDVVYQDVGADPREGKAASMAWIRVFMDNLDSLELAIHRISADGDTVLTERTDVIVSGGRESPLPVMGAFELRDGLVVAWRDYFDMGLATRMMSGETIEATILPSL